MVKTISFDTMQIENVVIFKQNDQWKVGVNFSLKSSTDGNLGRNVVIQLDEVQHLAVRKFLQPFIQITRDAMEIQDVSNFEDPPEEVIVASDEEVDVVTPLE